MSVAQPGTEHIWRQQQLCFLKFEWLSIHNGVVVAASGWDLVEQGLGHLLGRDQSAVVVNSLGSHRQAHPLKENLEQLLT
jgi:hypothetical protein